MRPYQEELTREEQAERRAEEAERIMDEVRHGDRELVRIVEVDGMHHGERWTGIAWEKMIGTFYVNQDECEAAIRRIIHPPKPKVVKEFTL